MPAYPDPPTFDDGERFVPLEVPTVTVAVGDDLYPVQGVTAARRLADARMGA